MQLGITKDNLTCKLAPVRINCTLAYLCFFSITPSILIVSYRSKWTLPLVRRELLGWSDLLAKLGGLFGLMMGASVISLLEIFYYCLIRPWRNEDADDAQRFRHVLPWRP